MRRIDTVCVGYKQVDADAFAAVCLEPYSRGRVLAAYSSPPSLDADAEAAAAGGIATIDLGTKKVLSKVCHRTLLSFEREVDHQLYTIHNVLSRSEAALAHG